MDQTNINLPTNQPVVINITLKQKLANHFLTKHKIYLRTTYGWLVAVIFVFGSLLGYNLALKMQHPKPLTPPTNQVFVLKRG